jgi:hypothetical protein
MNAVEKFSGWFATRPSLSAGMGLSSRDSMKRLKLFLLYAVAVGLLALWMLGGLDPVVWK